MGWDVEAHGASARIEALGNLRHGFASRRALRGERG